VRKPIIIAFVASLFLLLNACGSTEAWPVQVIGTPEELAPITGEWIGTYDGYGTGRSGSITFHLTEDPRGAHGDVLMVPKLERTRGNEVSPVAPALPGTNRAVH
jgi:hypothetical protein